MLETLRVAINSALVILAIGSILGLIVSYWIVFEGAAGAVRESRSHRNPKPTTAPSPTEATPDA